MAKYWGKGAFNQFIAPVIISAILGGLLSVGTAWVVGARDHADAVDLANNQFLQSQRLTAYSSFITASEELLRAERNASRIFKKGQKPSRQADGQSRIDAIGDLNVKLQTAAAEAQMLGNPRVGGGTQAVVADMEYLSAVFFNAYDRFDKLTDADLKQIEDNANGWFTVYYLHKKEFLEAIKPDFPSSKN